MSDIHALKPHEGIEPVLVPCPHCHRESSVANGVEDFGSALVVCQHCKQQFLPDFRDGRYLTRPQYAGAERVVLIANGGVRLARDVEADGDSFSTTFFFKANLMLGLIVEKDGV